MFSIHSIFNGEFMWYAVFVYTVHVHSHSNSNFNFNSIFDTATVGQPERKSISSRFKQNSRSKLRFSCCVVLLLLLLFILLCMNTYWLLLGHKYSIIISCIHNRTTTFEDHQQYKYHHHMMLSWVKWKYIRRSRRLIRRRRKSLYLYIYEN